jgi:hypothetical protein
MVVAGQVGDGAGDFQNAVVGPGAEMQLLHCLFQGCRGFGVEGLGIWGILNYFQVFFRRFFCLSYA